MLYKNPLFKNLSPYPGGIHQIQVASTFVSLLSERHIVPVNKAFSSAEPPNHTCSQQSALGGGPGQATRHPNSSAAA